MTEQSPLVSVPGVTERVGEARLALEAALDRVGMTRDPQELQQAADGMPSMIVTAERLAMTATQRRSELLAEQQETEELDKAAIHLCAATYRLALGRHRINAAELRAHLESPEEDDRFFDFYGMSDEEFGELFSVVRGVIAEDTGAEWSPSGPEHDEHWSLIPPATEERTIEPRPEPEDAVRPPRITPTEPKARPVGVAPGEVSAAEAPPVRQPQPPKRERQPQAPDPAFTVDEVQATTAVLDVLKGPVNVGGMELAKLARAVGDNEKATRALIARLVDRGILSREAQKGKKRGAVIRRAVASKGTRSAIASLSEPFSFDDGSK